MSGGISPGSSMALPVIITSSRSQTVDVLMETTILDKKYTKITDVKLSKVHYYVVKN